MLDTVIKYAFLTNQSAHYIQVILENRIITTKLIWSLLEKDPYAQKQTTQANFTRKFDSQVSLKPTETVK